MQQMLYYYSYLQKIIIQYDVKYFSLPKKGLVDTILCFILMSDIIRETLIITQYLVM